MATSPNNMQSLPSVIENQDQLEEVMSRPLSGVAEELSKLTGDLVVLGVGGKMGPSLVQQARRALDAIASTHSVIGVSRFQQAGLRDYLESWRIKTVYCDLLDRRAVMKLPDAAAVIFMAGMKFGSAAAQSLTWAMNTYLPSLVCERYAGIPTVVFSSGNLYPMVPIQNGGASEETPPGPIGEYAQSVLGRERIFEHFSRTLGTKILQFRLFYALELRYGILHDVAQSVWNDQPVNVINGYANCIWQGDANAMALRSLGLVRSPPTVLNVTSPDRISFRKVAEIFGKLLGKTPQIEGKEQETTCLANATKMVKVLGKPTVDLDTMLHWISHWIKNGGPSLNKPTHFEIRNGNY